ncbi:broad-complex core protein-like isoform X1 [Penaeus monodon]|uniref:broad-complex core protein-like isoform X1 n=1 Tax=Penaeus monodon TaxID=6687 RepID=UPI0018A6E79D|nr:broad-complex core protein-like isoform X1 [Penaeus monodon]XP_037788213.1 broad-complex core protein-like isoform X1 [Penaeus monodon]XP_037788214.1 broad-complex core protein-like isoform X1 [Penaeus monodon]XP_037788216.1 broad-complex core protein-like isoform X1 [Penaeus monodon]XP_037788217.1 broad-complex core protein-like isoform X1 [Penaeus monodon]
MSEYCLRWNNHRPNLVTVFSELLTSEALVDVTLATDGHYIHAHKLVLSACSVYFKDLFGANPCKHPIVILKDIRIDDLKTVIDFIYRGEVNVAQDRLQDVLKTAESLRIKGLAENPRSYDEMSSHGARFSQSSIGSQVTRQRSSLTDSREQSSSLEGEEEAEPGTPPSTKRRKITPSHDSSESVHEETENDNKACSYEVKDEPVDDRENERSQSRGAEQESNVNRVADAMLMLQGVSSDNADESGNTPGTSSDSTLTSSHSQGRGKRGVLQRQHGIIRDAAGEERREENREATHQQQHSQQSQHPQQQQVPQETGKSDTKDAKGDAEKEPELIIPDTVVVSGGTVTLSSNQPTLLQVPTMVVGHRDSIGPGPLPKQHSHPTPLLTPTPIISKQLSHPESRGPPTHQGPPQMSKQRSHPGVLTHTPSPSERLPSTTTTTSTSSTAPQQQQHLQVIPMHLVMKPRPPPVTMPSQLRPIQPKPCEGPTVSEPLPKKEIPLIRLTPSEDGGNVNISSSGFNMSGCTVTGPSRPIRALSEEPAMSRQSMTHTHEQLAPGPSVLIQSVSQDSGLDSGTGNRMLSTPQLSVTTTPPLRPASSPGHCPVLRGGPALGCNFCWNSTDPQGRVLRRKTKYHCPECRTNLCIVPCFHEYHKQIERSQDTDKQITKILTKTSSL